LDRPVRGRHRAGSLLADPLITTAPARRKVTVWIPARISSTGL
jgi:hypothetical protein